MILNTTHTTTYLYSEPVSICHTQVHLAPRISARQRVLKHKLDISPEPDFSVTRTDYFGNEITCFSVHEPHQMLTISAQSELDLDPEEPPAADLTPPWEHVRDEALAHADEESLRASEFLFRSPYVKVASEFAAYAEPSFRAGRAIIESGFDLCHRIFTDFRYAPQATTISTPVDEVLKSRVGVCQDFAHLMISCLRSMRLPARYVSGYLRSGENTHGAEASHAWCAVWCPGFGWLEFDPTNDVIPQGNHATLAWGRDYSDVAPVKGVAVGGGEQLINVSVQVVPASTED